MDMVGVGKEFGPRTRPCVRALTQDDEELFDVHQSVP